MEEFTRQLQASYGMDPANGTVADVDTLSFLDNEGQQTAVLLRETLAHYVAAIPGKSEKEKIRQGLDRIIREQSFTVLNRLAALRMAEARGFLIESIARGTSSKGFQLYKNLAGTALGETGDAYRCFLFSLFDEFSLDLAVLFDRHSVQGRLFPREAALLALLDQINHFEIEPLWAEDETIGWIYQYFNSQEERKQMRKASQAPRNSRELAVRNQFFTPRYVVEFLTDNTLGRIWYDMTQGHTALKDVCRYLVRRPNEIFLAPGETAPETAEEHPEELSREELLQQPVYVPFRRLKDPRELRMLDPACGSMHFGLYAFDLFETIYEEAWHIETDLGPDVFDRSTHLKPLQETYAGFDEFKQAIPQLIIEQNIHGVDIDPRAVQIAGLSLWQRAQRAWHQMGIKPGHRPSIRKSNIVCAEPMPGEKELLREFTAGLNPPVLGQLVETIFDKMQLAGEAGTLLKIEQEITSAISDAKDAYSTELLRQKEQEGFLPGMAPKREPTLFDFAELHNDSDFWETAEEKILTALKNYAAQAESHEGQKRLFAEDAAKGFAFIDLCRKRFDVVLMNPPFGESSYRIKSYIDDLYPYSKGNILATFVERTGELLRPFGEIGAITSRSFLFLTSMSEFREQILLKKLNIELCADMGDGVLEAMVETAVYTISKQKCSQSVFFRCLLESNKEKKLKDLCHWNDSEGNSLFLIPSNSFNSLTESPFTYWVPASTLSTLNSYEMVENKAKVAVGLQTGDDFRFYRNFWEVPIDGINKDWYYTSKTETAHAWHSPFTVVVNWKNDGYELSNFYNDKGKLKSRPQNVEYYFSPGFSYMARSTRLVPYIIPKGCIPVAPRAQVFPEDGFEVQTLAVCASNLGSSVARFRGEKFAHPLFQAGMVQKINFNNISESLKKSINEKMLGEIKNAKEYFSNDETTLDFLGIMNLNEKSPQTPSLSTLLGEEHEVLVAKEYGLDEDEYNALQLDLQQALSLRKSSSASTENDYVKIIAYRYLSYIVGCAFGRWEINYCGQQKVQDIYEKLPNQPVAFKKNGFNNYIETNGIADLESNKSIIDTIQKITADKINGIDKALSLCGIKDWNQFLSKVTNFFDFHLNQYSQNRRPSPIYWPLQTPSGSYTLWVYYHRLTDQTLYTCVNDFVEPKLKTVTEDLTALRNQTTRSSVEEKELVRLSDLEGELKNFRDELLRIAGFWKPDLNDGVQITAAPLWKLFQHRQWQNKLKETWKKLENGEYDWAHLACSIWPERVLRKCHSDRSLAIAHDVETDFWQEMEVPVIRRGKDTGKTKLEWQPKPLTESRLQELIHQKMAAMRSSH
jgi:hypothetical protein